MRFRIYGPGLALLCLSSAAFAADESGQRYAVVERALLDGKTPRMTLNLALCQVQGTDKPGPSVQANLGFDAFMILGEQGVAFRTTHFTVRPDKKAVDETLSFRLRPTGRLEVQTMHLDAATHVPFYEAAYDCELGKAARFHWQ
jgi:hypothetical protein